MIVLNDVGAFSGDSRQLQVEWDERFDGPPLQRGDAIILHSTASRFIVASFALRDDGQRANIFLMAAPEDDLMSIWPNQGDRVSFTVEGGPKKGLPSWAVTGTLVRSVAGRYLNDPIFLVCKVGEIDGSGIHLISKRNTGSINLWLKDRGSYWQDTDWEAVPVPVAKPSWARLDDDLV